MLNWLFKNNKPIIVCIHGFGRRRSVEFDYLKAQFPQYDFVIPNLYDQSNTEDNNQDLWIKRGLDALLEAQKSNRPIYLLGFSMGGVIASYLASIVKVKKLILIAPAFEYLTIKTATSAINNLFTTTKKDDEFVDLPKNFSSTFMDIVDKYKDRIYQVTCPIMIIHASNDEVIPYTVSMKVFPKIPNENKKCFILQGGRHCLLDDKALQNSAIYLIKGFIEDKI